MTEGNTVEKQESLPAGTFGQFLAGHKISSKPLPDSCGTETIELAGDDLHAAMKLLRQSPETAFDFLVCLSGLDSPETYDSVYHLWSYSNNNELVVKVKVAKSTLSKDQLPAVPSLAPFWCTANWHERESYDLLGIDYAGHPYLRRILNPWDWEGYPLRRDYKQPVDALNDKNPHSFR